MSKKITVSKAIREGLLEEMRRDDKMFIMGEDMAVMGNVFAVTTGFLDEFGPNRVIDTPISEEGFLGMAVGAAMRGMHPCVELMYDDFVTVCADPLFNQAAKLKYMSGGQCSIPLVLRMPMGSGRRNAGQHSQSLEGMVCHFPGLKVVAPCSAADAKGLIKSAMRDPDPVVVFEHKLLYAKKEEIPEDEDYLVPIGKANVKREGKDLTIITWSREVNFSMEAAEKLAAEGISVEVVDPRTIAPLDKDTIFNSIRKTHRAAIVEESNKTSGIGAEFAAMFQEELYDELDGPVTRIAALDVPMPYNIPMEHYSIPSVDSICKAIRAMF